MRIVVGVTGASGAAYARRLLGILSSLARDRPPRELEVHWVLSAQAPQVWRHELREDAPAELPGLRRWDRADFAAPFASGSSPADAVVCIPCSMSTLARVAHGGGDDLIARTCEVALKERRRLVLVTRETPLSLVHLRNMTDVTMAGAVVLPASPSFYVGDGSVEAALDSVVARVLDHLGLPLGLLPRWGEA